MSWFTKVRSFSKVSGLSENNSSVSSDGRMRSNTDPETCLEVFRNHWDQAWDVIQRRHGLTIVQCDLDEVEIVTHNFEQMVTLLGGEDGIAGAGMPGPILHFILENDVLEKYCGWCCENIDYSERLQLEQLRLFELLLGQSRQLLLIHKPVIIPLLKLLSVCAVNCKSRDIEVHLVLVLHQICASIAQETSILESFIYNSTDQGRAKFLIFSLLIPYLHREGTVGQQARDALLLIMALSSRHPYIVKYIAEFSDFCPVLASGLSGLYSALPRKLPMLSQDCHCLADEEIMDIPELQMFLNSLEFCNAVVQIACKSVTEQLITYIYSGFLVPVLAPALSLDLTGLPQPILDSSMFANSREEIITATVYLNIFLKRITEPPLIKAFLTCMMVETFDDMTILDSLINRINSNTQLSLVTLSLFKTLIDLNCEDLMFLLVFRYLIPCTHVMISQRRAVRDVDLYGKSAEKFLSLRPSCCVSDLSESPQRGNTPTTDERGYSVERTRTSYPTSTFGNRLEHYETNYLDYLHEARQLVEKCYIACRNWASLYDGESPNVKSFDLSKADEQDISQKIDSLNAGVINSLHSILNTQEKNCDEDDKLCETVESVAPSSLRHILARHIVDGKSVNFQDPVVSETYIVPKNSITQSTEHMENFLAFLGGMDSPPEYCQGIEESMVALENLITDLSLTDLSQIYHVETDDDKTMGTDMQQTTRNSRNLNADSDPETKQCNNESSAVSIESGAISMFSEPSHVEINGSQYQVIKVPKEVGNSMLSAESVYGDDNRSQNNLCSQENSDFVEISMSKDIKCYVENVPHQFKNSTLSPDTDDSGEVCVRDSSVFYKSDILTSPEQLPLLQNKIPCLDSIRTLHMGPPDIGPFLKMLFCKLDLMMQNSYEANLLLTGLIARLAAYPQPLLRSFLLSHNLVFQPTVKSLTQVLTTIRQKVDRFSYTVKNFDHLLLKVRRTLAAREEVYLADLEEKPRTGSTASLVHHSPINFDSTVRKSRSSTASEPATSTPKEKRRTSLTERLFKRPSPKLHGSIKKREIQIIPGKGSRYISQQYLKEEPFEPKTRNAIYCAVVLEEFVKELAALSQEHAVLCFDEGYASS